MKKVLSVCVLSVLLAVLSLGLKAQSGLVLTPANLPDPMVLNQYDTIYLSPNSACFDALGLSDTSRISIEWQVLYNGSVIPDDSLSFYFEEFKFESRKDFTAAETWWGRTYVSSYCQNGDGYGTYPGANIPTAHLDLGQMCEDPGHFIISLPGQNNPCQFDFFFVRWFKDAAHTAHRLVYSIKVDGDYQFVFSLGRRCGGDPYTTFTENNDQRYLMGGHGSTLCGILSSDTLHSTQISNITDYYRCVGDSLVIGNPAVVFTVNTDTTIDPGYDSVFYMGPSSCNAAIDSIVRFRVFFEDPSAPVLDTANSILALCDSGQISIMVNLTAADKSIWLDAAYTVIDTLNASTAFIDTINANTQYYVLGYNSASGCVSSDTLIVYTEVFASPNPVVTATPDTLCENSALTITLDQEYDKWTWFHDGTNMNLDTIVYQVADAHTTDAGSYWAEVSMNHVHSVYPTVDTIACAAADTAVVTVFTRPSVAWVTLDGNTVTDSTTFCPNDLTHVFVATISGGQTPYDNIHWTGTTGTESYSTNKDYDTLSVTVANTCGTAYTVGIDYAIDSNGCTLKDTIEVTFFINDTIDPVVTKMRDTVSAPNYSNCQYIIPGVIELVTASDNCIIDTVVQVPEAGQLVTTDTIVVVTATDLCGNTSSDTIKVNLPVAALVIDTVEVLQQVSCAGYANGEIEITVEGGLAPYDVTIQSTKVADSIKTAHGAATQTVFAFDGLIEGKWVITVTDTNGCVAAQDTVDVAAPNVLTLTASDWTDLTCYNDSTGSFKFQVTGGTLPYSVNIERTLGSTVENTSFTLNPSTADTIVTMTQQLAGVYVISVEDANNCNTSLTDSLTQPEPLVLVGDTVLAHVLCFGDSIGNIAVTSVTGGVYPYSYAWLNDANDTVSTDSVTGAILPAGYYTIYVTDAHGCSASPVLTDTINQPKKLTLAANNWTNLTCFESNDGSFDFTITEGTKPYTVTIHRALGSDVEDVTLNLNPTTLDTTVYMTNQKAGEYFISVVDANGCIADTVRDTLTQPDQLTLLGDTILNHVKCFGDANGNLALTGVTGGTLPYSFEWRYASNDSVVSTDSVTGRILTAGTYKIYVTDVNNCAPNDTLSATILGPDTTLTVMSLVAPVNDTCPHLGNYVFTSEVKGGRTDYTFVWTFNADTVFNHVTNALTDTFTYNETVVSCDTTFDVVFTVTDDSACVASKNLTFTIQDTTKPVLSGTIDTVTIDGCVASAAPDTLNTIAKLKAAGLTVYDNCTDTLDLVVNYAEVVTGTCPIKVVRTYSVTDKCGLTSDEITQVIFVQDTTPPVFTTLPQNRSVACDGSGNTLAHNSFKNQKAQAAVSDNCTALTSDDIVMTLDTIIQGCNSSTLTYRYSFTVSDACGNTTTEYATFSIYDSVAPYFTGVAPNVERECSINDLQTIREQSLALFTFTDACVGQAYLVLDTLSDFVKDCGTTGSYTHYVIITDSCQTDTASHKIIIVDNTRPVIHANAQTHYAICDGRGNLDTLYQWLYSVTAEDACSGPIDSITVRYLSVTTGIYEIFDTLTLVKDADGRFVDAWDGDGCDGAYHFQWEVVDSCNNSQTAEESFRIADTEGPVFTLTREDTVVLCGTPYSKFIEWLTLPDAYDVCSRLSFPVEVTDTTFVPGCGSTGIYSVSWRVSDTCGRPSLLHTATYSIIDTIAPVIVSLGDTLRNDTLYFGNVPDWAEPAISDWDVSMANSSESETFITSFLAGSVYDGHEWHDLNTGVTAIEECGYLSAFYYTNMGEDPNFTATGCEKQYIVDYTFVDACNRPYSISQTVVILDTTPPIVDNIVDTMYLKGYNDGCVKETVDTFFTIQDVKDHPKANPQDQNILSILDDNNYVTLLSDTTFSAPGSACDSIEVRTYEIKDACENARTFTHTIMYFDTIAPVISPEVVYDTIHQKPDCIGYYELEAGLATHFTDKDWLETNYNLSILSCHDVTITWVSDVDDIDDGVCPGKVIAKKYKVTKECASREYDSYFTIRLIVKDTIAPVHTAATLHDTTVFFKSYADGCTFDLPAVEFEHYEQMLEWTGGTDLYTDCNLGQKNNVAVYGPFTSGDKCDSVIIYKYTVADSCGNMSADTISLTIHVRDTLAPAITVATATLVDTMYYELDCSLPSPLNYWTKPADALDHNVEYEDCFPAYGADKLVRLTNETSERDNCTTIITVPYQVKDSCDNISDTIFQVIHILDTVAPVASTVKDTATYMIDDASACWGPEVPYFHTVGEVKAYDAAFTVTDCNVGDNSIVEMVRYDSSDIVLCTRTVVRTYVVYDSCGLVSNEFTHTITVEDTTAPAITGVLVPQQVTMDEDCGFTYTVYGKVSELPTSITINDCTLVDTLYSVIDTFATAYIDACNKAYTVNIAYTVKDSCNHASMFYDTVYVADNIAPKVEGLLDTVTLYLSDVDACNYDIDPLDTTYSFTSVAYINTHTSVTITDCKLKDDLTVSGVDTVHGYCPMLIHRTYTVSDSCGNTTNFDQFFFVKDTFAPKVEHVTLPNDTVYITEAGTYTAPTQFGTAAELNVAGAGIKDCNLVQEVHYYEEIPSLDTVNCDNYLTRKYVVKDSCENYSDTIFHKIVLLDTIKPVMVNMPDTVWSVRNGACVFVVPDLRDTVRNHYHDNWTTSNYDAAHFVSQVPAPGDTLVNPRDTIVVVTFKDYCDNMNTDTIRIINRADTVAPHAYPFDTLNKVFAATFTGSCTFVVPNLRDTIKNHYSDYWNDVLTTGLETYDTLFQMPAPGEPIPHFMDTIVTIVFNDVCGNKDTVKITIDVPDSLVISASQNKAPTCFGYNDGEILVDIVQGGTDPLRTGGFTYFYVYDTIASSRVSDTLRNAPADTFVVTVKDEFACFDTTTVIITQPTKVVLTPYVSDNGVCMTRDTSNVAIIMTGGIPDYNVHAVLYNIQDVEVDTIEFEAGQTITTLHCPIGDTISTDSVRIDPQMADTLYVIFYGVDHNGCPVIDTSDYIIVHPTYLFVKDTMQRVCPSDIASGYDWYDAQYNHTWHIDAAYFTSMDSVYILYDSLQTVTHGCDSIFMMELKVTNKPFLKTRKTPAIYDDNDPLVDAIEQIIMDTISNRNGSLSWEIFVDKNCMSCTANDPVSLQYEWYHKNGDNWELLSNNVTNYFFPQYRTYYDNTPMDWYPAANNMAAANQNTVDIPTFYGAAMLQYRTLNYYKLCWLSPVYDVPCLQSYYPSYNDLTSYGTFYPGGRANTIRVQNFIIPGDYKVVVSVLKRTGGAVQAQFHTFSSCMVSDTIGGRGSSIESVYETTEIQFFVPDSVCNTKGVPVVAPIGGEVTYSSGEEEPQANVYPNPARDFVQVEIMGFEGQTNVSLSNTGGKVLKNINLNIDDVNTTSVIKIETGDYSQGVYMVTVRSKDAIVTKRVVIIR